MIVQKDKLHHLIIVYSTSMYKFVVMLEIITLLNIRDNNVVLIIDFNYFV